MKLFTMNFKNNAGTEDAVCAVTREQLSAYLDNTLSARDVWNVEKHLTACPECAEVSRQMQATVHLLHSVERLDTGDDFMAKLHARLDGLEPEPARQTSLKDWTREAGTSLRAGLVSRRAPGFGLGMAAAGIAAFAVLTHLPSPVVPDNGGAAVASAPITMPQSSGVHESLPRNVALTANDPLGDVAAEYLESAEGAGETNSKETNGRETNGS